MFSLLPIATLGYGVGIILADQALVDIALARVIATFGLLAGLCSRRRPGLHAAAAVVLIGACGVLALAGARERAARVPLAQPREALVEGTVCALRGTGAALAFDLCACRAVGPAADPVPPRLRVFESLDSEPTAALLQLRNGQRIRTRLRLTPIRAGANPGSRSRQNAYARRGIGALASLRDPAMLVRLETPVGIWKSAAGEVRGVVESWRRSIGERLSRHGAGGRLIRALALGDRSTLARINGDAFARVGIGHLLAVSGLHLALVAGLAFGTVRRVCLRSARLSAHRDPREIALLAAFAIALLYAGMSGWGIPVRRALLFLGVVCLSVASRRTVRGGQLLSLAALPLLIAEPHALFEMGAQLSFVASAGLLLARRPARVESSAFASLIRTSATAIAATAPWVAWHGGSVGVWGVAANLIAVPWVGFVMLPASLLAACLAALPEMTVATAIIGFAAQLGALTLDCVVAVATRLPASPTGGAPAWVVLLGAGMLSLLALRARSTATRVLLSIAGSALLSLAPAREIAPLPPRVVSFDVGQGDATVVEGRSGALLIDGGRAFGDSLDMGRRVVVPGLAALGIEALDLVIASHADLDHRGGLETVLRRVPVRVLWLPRGSLEEPGFRRLLEIANERGVTVVERGAGDPPTRFGDLRVVPIWPPRDNAPIGRNDSSLVVRVEVFEAGEVLESVLLPGDLGAVAERRLIELDVELRSTILKVGHHGSRGSSTGEFLAVVRPEIALVSAPCFGRGGLPSASSMQRLRESSAEVWWTGSSGAVIVGLTTRSRTRTVTGWHQNVQCWKH